MSTDREALEKAWQARGIPPDAEDSPWCVSASLRREFEAGWAAALAASPSTSEPTDGWKRGDRVVAGNCGTGTVVQPTNAAGNVGVYWDTDRLNTVEWPRSALLKRASVEPSTLGEAQEQDVVEPSPPLWWTPEMQAAAKAYGRTLYQSSLGYGERVKLIFEAAGVPVPPAEAEERRINRLINALSFYASERNWLNRCEIKAFPGFHGKDVAANALKLESKPVGEVEVLLAALLAQALTAAPSPTASKSTSGEAQDTPPPQKFELWWCRTCGEPSGEWSDPCQTCGDPVQKWPMIAAPSPTVTDERKTVATIMDFLNDWRFCPVATSPKPSRACLEDAAKQLLAALSRGDSE
jgi:hypothetical protein